MHCRKLYAHTKIHTVGLGRDIQFLTDIFHPLAAASSYGNNTLLAVDKPVIAHMTRYPPFARLSI